MKPCFGLFAVLLSASTLFALPLEEERSAPAQPPYVGEWSNGRGEVLIVTKKTLKFGDDKPVVYWDVTKATDNDHFKLMLTTRAKVNYFDKFVWVSMSGRRQMKIEMAESIEKYAKGEASSQTWHRDK